MLSERSRARLEGVHPDLVAVVEKAAESCEFIVTEGLRSKARQKELVRKGASRTLNSRHLTGHAVDLADVKATYKPEVMKIIADAMKAAASDLGIQMKHGIDWGWDSPHHELDAKVYPGTGVTVKERIVQAAKTAASARVVTGAGVGATAAVSSPETVSEAVKAIPAVPPALTDAISNVTAWQSTTEVLWGFKSWAVASPLQAACLAALVAFAAFWPHGASAQSSLEQPPSSD